MSKDSLKTLYLVRHCQATGQEPEALLTSEGQAQAVQLVNFFKDKAIDIVYSSPYQRAQQTCIPLVEQRHMPVILDQRLEEKVLSGEPREDWFECLRLSFQNHDLCFAGGETSAQAQVRGLQVIKEWLAQSEQEVALMVTHGALLTLLLNAYDQNYGFEEWQALTNPDVFQLCFTTTGDNQPAQLTELKRIWHN